MIYKNILYFLEILPISINNSNLLGSHEEIICSIIIMPGAFTYQLSYG